MDKPSFQNGILYHRCLWRHLHAASNGATIVGWRLSYRCWRRVCCRRYASRSIFGRMGHRGGSRLCTANRWISHGIYQYVSKLSENKKAIEHVRLLFSLGNFEKHSLYLGFFDCAAANTLPHFLTDFCVGATINREWNREDFRCLFEVWQHVRTFL